MSSALEQLVGNMTIAQLAANSGITVNDLVEALRPRGETKPTAARKTKPTAARETQPTELSDAGTGSSEETTTRTRAGREALDAAILSFLEGQPEPVRSLTIRQAVGGTPAQVRTRLNFMIEKGEVNYTGRASGTRYRAVGVGVVTA